MNYITCITNRAVSSKSIKLLISTFYIIIHLGSEEIIKDKLQTLRFGGGGKFITYHTEV